MTRALAGERTLGYVAVAVTYLQIVFGAIVRITGSGMGCGDHWPKCEGRFFPPLSRPDLIIEVTHRYLAVALSVVVVAVLIAAIRRRRAGDGTLLPSALTAAALVVVAALLGAVTVKMTLAAPVVVAHKVLALALLAVLAHFTMLAGGFGAAGMATGMSVTKRTRSGSIALALAILVVIIFGAFTANVAGAAGSCIGFPHCRETFFGGMPLTLHIVHRVLAFAVLGHAIGLLLGMRRRSDARILRRTGAVVVTLIVVQLLIAAAMVEMAFPPVVRSLHQATGAATWLGAFVLAALTRSGASGGGSQA